MAVQTNPEIETIIANATNVAESKNHEYVTLEHLLQGMLSYDPFAEFITNYGADIDKMQQELDDYLDKQEYLKNIANSIVPKKTHSLERVFNRAYTQVLFSGRQSLQTIDLFLSIMTEDKSYASYLMVKYGIDRNRLVNLWNKTFSDVKSTKASSL
jgi:ATP-dependent Clp protease ATP-binding subunit ClpA